MKQIQHFIFSTSFLIFFFNVLEAQDSKLRHFDINEGLPSKEVYYSLQDNKGYLWFATDRGVCKYDGYEFKTFTTQDGLKDNTIFLMREDSLGRIWFLGYASELCYYQDGKIHDYQFNEQIKFLGVGKIPKADIIIGNDTIFIGTQGKGYYWISGQGESFYQEFDDFRFGLKTTSSGNLIYSNNFTSATIKDSLKSFSIKGQVFKYPRKGSSRAMKYEENKALIVSDGLNTLCYRDHKLINYWEQTDKMLNIYKDRKSNYWVCYQTGGVVVCKDPWLNMENGQPIILKNMTVSSVTEDFEGGMWFTTVGNGVYYWPPGLKFLNELPNELPKDQVIDITSNKDEDVFISYSTGEIWKLTTEHRALLISKPISEQQSKFYYPIYYDEATDKLIHEERLKKWHQLHMKSIITKYREARKYSYRKRKPSIPFYMDIQSDRDGGFFVSHNRGFNHYKNDSLIDIKIDLYTKQNGELRRSRQSRIDAIHVTREKQKIVASIEGLSLVYGDTLVFLGDHEPLLRGRFDVLTSGLNNTIYAGSRAKGLVVWQEDTIYNIDLSNGLLSNQVNTIHIVDQSTVWVGTDKGLSRIKWKANGMPAIYNISGQHGLPADQVKSILSLKNYLFVGTNKGLCKLSLDRLHINKVAPKIYVTSVKVNGVEVSMPKINKVELQPNQNQITFSFTALAYKNIRDIAYSYKLIGLEEQWQKTSNREIRYNSLPPGDYTLHVKATNEDGISNQPQMLSFTILKPLWLRTWFLTVSIILVVLFAYYGLKKRDSIVKADASKQKRIMELELKALRSQINPHFTFNTLNSIQQYIMEKDRIAANDYLSDFAALIRKVLENSNFSEISLEEEIHTLEMYLKLESKRFEDKLNYHIRSETESDKSEVMVPTMIIQPFVENAIIHGVLQSNKKGKIDISFEQKVEELKVVIKDNGIGRKASKQQNKNKLKTKNSMGLKMTEERLSLLRQSKDKKYTLRIIDLEDAHQNALGTQVELLFPLNLKYA